MVYRALSRLQTTEGSLARAWAPARIPLTGPIYRNLKIYRYIYRYTLYRYTGLYRYRPALPLCLDCCAYLQANLLSAHVHETHEAMCMSCYVCLDRLTVMETHQLVTQQLAEHRDCILPVAVRTSHTKPLSRPTLIECPRSDR
jgi:hypothetical protein